MPSSEPIKKIFTYKGEPLAYLDEGKGKAVLLLHGYLLSSDIWKDFICNLSQTYRVICPDLPGHGSSGCWGYLHTMEFMAECVYGLIRHLAIRKCTMFGHSMGGYVTLAFAEKYPDILRSYGLLFSTPLADSPEKKRNRIRSISLIKRKKKLYIRETFRSLFQPQEIKYFRKEYETALHMAQKISSRGAIAALRGMMLRPDRELLLRFPPVPVLMLNGSNDHLLPANTMEEIFSRNKQVYGILAENLGHMGFMEYPAYCIRTIRYFLSASQ